MIIYQQEYNDGLSDLIKSNASICYASALEPSNTQIKSKTFQALASIDDNDLYYTQSILVSSSWNKNDDIFDKVEVWNARQSPEHKPTNLEHDEGIIIGHIVSNYPITEDGILIDENTPIENLPNKYHILTGAVIYKSYTKPELKDRTEKLISEIENGTKYVSMECFFKGFDYGLINKSTGEFKVLARNNDTAYLTKYLRAYGGIGEHDNYKLGRVLRHITFSGKGYVDKPANPDSIIFNKDNFKFLEKNNNLAKSGVSNFQSIEQMENNQMSDNIDNAVANDTKEEVVITTDTVVAELQSELETLKTSHAETLSVLTTEKEQLAAEKDQATQKIVELESQLVEAKNTIAGYLKKEKKMARKAALVESGIEDENLDNLITKFDNVDDETFAAMTEMLKNKKKKMDQTDKLKDTQASTDLTEVLDHVETTEEVVPAIGGEEDTSEVDTTRAALVNFVCNRLGKKLNKGE